MSLYMQKKIPLIHDLNHSGKQFAVSEINITSPDENRLMDQRRIQRISLQIIKS